MSSDRAHELMLSQVGVAEEAVRQAIQGRTSDVGRGKVGLCLGPFGATLQPGQESVHGEISALTPDSSVAND